MCKKDVHNMHHDPDMDIEEFTSHDIPVRRIQIKTEQSAKAFGRDCGQYITMYTGPLDGLIDFEGACECLIEQLRPMLEPYYGKPLCICGIGNRDSEFDSLGPETVKRIRLTEYEAFSFTSVFEKAATICPGTISQTGLPTETIISGVVSAMNAACILTIDSSMCRDLETLCSTIQLCDAGMRSWWGTADLRQSSLGIPVISIVMPTAISIGDLCNEENSRSDLFMSPIHVSNAIELAAFVIGCAITRIIYPHLDYEKCKQLITLFLLGIV